MNNHGKGNRKAQRQRKIERNKHLPQKQEEKVELIDGNYSYFPVAYCWYYGAYLTQGLIDSHRCIKRKCRRIERL